MGATRTEEDLADARRYAELGCAAARRGANGEAVVSYDQALALLEVGAPTTSFVDVLRWKGTALRELGDTDGADALYRRSLAVASQLGYLAGRAHALNCLAILAQMRGEMNEAERLYNDAARLAAEARESRLLGMIGQNLGVVANIRGDAERALHRFRMSLCAFVEAGDDYAVSELLNNLGMLYTQQRRLAEAEQAFSRALAIAQSCGALMIEGVVELNRAEMFAAAGRWLEADASCARAMSVAEQRGDRLRLAEALKLRGVMERNRANLDGAARTLEHARRLAAESDDALLSIQVLRELGEVWGRLGDHERARSYWQQALEGFRRLGAARDAADVERCLSRAC